MKSRTANVLILLSAVLLWVFLASPASVTTMARSVSPVYRAAAYGRVSLQCLVGWDAEAMDEILAVLKEKAVRITFAVSADWAGKHRDKLKEMTAFGHGIALLDEPDADTLTLIESITGIRPALCVFGRDDPKGYRRAEELGLKAVRCTFDLGEDRGVGETVGEGSIINAYPTAAFAEALPKIIEKIKNMGLDIVPTHKMLYN